MDVSAVQSSNSVQIINTQTAKKTSQATKSDVNEITDSYIESEETAKFKNIVSKYNITNMSRNEANQMYKELYNNGLISLKDLALATFDPTKLNNDIRRATGVNIGDSIIVSGWKQSTDPNEKMNYLEGFKTQAEYNRKYGNSEFQDNFDGQLELAEKIQYFQS